MRAMKRTQIYFPEDLLNELKKKAEAENTTISHIVRVAVTGILGEEKKKDWLNDPLWAIVGASSSQEDDVSLNHDAYLYGKHP